MNSINTVDPWTTQQLQVPTPHGQEPIHHFWPPKRSCFSASIEDWFQDSHRHPNLWDAQVSHVKWYRSVHTVVPSHLWADNSRSKTVQVFIEKGPHIRGPTQFKPMSFKGQLNFVLHKNTYLFVYTVYTYTYMYVKKCWKNTQETYKRLSMDMYKAELGKWMTGHERK